MKINEIIVESFRPYENKKSFIFEEGANLILGRNGKGKSTITDVIELLLFNKTEENLESLCNWNNPQKYFFISIDFFEKGDNYKVEMKYEKKGKTGISERTLYKNNKLEATNSDVNDFISNLFDIGIMQSALISAQRQAEIVEAKDSERRELLKRVQNLDYSKQVKNEIEPEIKQTDNDILSLEKELYFLDNQEYNKQEVPQEPFSKDEYGNKQHNITKMEKTLKNLSVKEVEKKHLLENKDTAEKEIIKLQSKKIELNEKLDRIDNPDDSKKDIKESINTLTKECEALKGKIENYTIDQYSITSEVRKVYEDEKNELISERAKKELELDDIKFKRIPPFKQLELDDIISRISKYENKKEGIQKELKDMAEGKCPTCGKPFDSSDISEKEKAFENIAEELSFLYNKKQELEDKRKSIEEKKEINDNNKLKKNRLEGDIERLSDKIELIQDKVDRDVEKRLSEEEQNLSSLKNEKNNIFYSIENKRKTLEGIENNLKMVETYRKEIISIKEEIADKEELIIDIDNTIEGIDNDLKEKPSLEIKLQELKLDTQRYDKYIEEYNRTIKLNEEIDKKEKEDKKKLKKVQKDIDKKRQYKNDLRTVKDILLKDFPNFVIDSKIDEIEYDMNKFIQEVYDKDLDIEFKKNKASIKLLYGNGKRKISAKGSSGAERKLIQLSFINSFNQQIDLNCLILDEPDESSDKYNAEKMYKLLGNMKDVYGQTIYITHKEEMKEYLTTNYDVNVIEV